MTIKWGILATGNIASKFTEDFKFINSGEVIAVASRTEEKARDFAITHGIDNYYSSYYELTNNEEIDIIYIATPHNLHIDNTLMCLDNEKAVLCEKPIAVNQSQLDKMIQKSQETNYFLMEAMWMYFLPTIIQVKKWIDQGVIGEVKHIKATFGFKAKYDPSSRLFNPKLAGGSLLDVGIYPIALALYLIDSSVTSINAKAGIGETDVDETTSITLQFRNGVQTDLKSSLVEELSNKAIITGTRGNITIPQFWSANQAMLQVNDGINKRYRDGRSSNGYHYEIEAVNQALNAGKIESELMPLVKSREIIHIMDRIREQIGLVYPIEA